MLPLENRLRVGVQTMHRRTEPAVGAWTPKIGELRQLVERVDRCGYDSMWVGDHVSFPIPFLDPLLQFPGRSDAAAGPNDGRNAVMVRWPLRRGTRTRR